MATVTGREPQVMAEGFGTGGERWTLTTASSGSRRRTMVEVVEADGRRWGAGFGGAPLPPGRRLGTFAGRSGGGAHLIIVRVAADVRAVVATLSDGTREDLSLHGDPAEFGARVAVLVHPPELDLHRLVLLDENGVELPDTL
jgi:hypothetical protein